MDDEARAELQRLRARAYGPHADIADDPAALRRLRELERPGGDEDAVALPPAGLGWASDPGGADPAAVVAAAIATSSEPTTAEPTPPEPPAPTTSSWWRRHRIPVLWTASVVVAAILSVVATLLVVNTQLRFFGLSADARPVATLGIETTIPVPAFLGTKPGVSEVFEDYHGLTLLTFPSWTDDPMERCYVIVRTDSLELDADFITGPTFSGCDTQEFPVATTVRVTRELPDSIRELFPDLSALLFILDGDRVTVFSEPATAD